MFKKKRIDPLRTSAWEEHEMRRKAERRAQRIARAKFIAATLPREPLYAIAMLIEPLLCRLHQSAANRVQKGEDEEVARTAEGIMEAERVKRQRDRERQAKNDSHVHARHRHMLVQQGAWWLDRNRKEP